MTDLRTILGFRTFLKLPLIEQKQSPGKMEIQSCTQSEKGPPSRAREQAVHLQQSFSAEPWATMKVPFHLQGSDQFQTTLTEVGHYLDLLGTQQNFA